MKVTKEKVENSQAFLTVEMDPAEMEKSMEASYRRLAKKTNIPGFRKGKAPRAILENYIGRESLLEEAMKQMVPQAYEEAVKEHEITPFAQPDIEITQSDPVIFKAVVPLQPTVTLGDYHSISMTPETEEITDDNVKAVLEELRHQNATWEPVERPLDFGDMAALDVDSEVDGLPFVKKLGAQYQVVRDSVSPAPGFAEKLVSMKKDEEKEFTLKLPDDFIQSDFAGKEASFKVKLSEIKEEKLPPLDDELAKQVSTEFKNLDELREEVLKNLKRRAEERTRMDFEEKVVNAVVEQSQVEFPPVVVEMEIDRLINEQARQIQMGGRNFADYLKTINKAEDELREEMRPVATKNVTGSLVLYDVAEKEGIKVEDAEIEGEIDGMVKGVDEEKKGELHKLMDTPQTRDSIRRSLLIRKTIAKLTEIARGQEAAGTEAKKEEEQNGQSAE